MKFPTMILGLEPERLRWARKFIELVSKYLRD
jgi:hypothetical protein